MLGGVSVLVSSSSPLVADESSDDSARVVCTSWHHRPNEAEGVQLVNPCLGQVAEVTQSFAFVLRPLCADPAT